MFEIVSKVAEEIADTAKTKLVMAGAATASLGPTMAKSVPFLSDEWFLSLNFNLSEYGFLIQIIGLIFLILGIAQRALDVYKRWKDAKSS